ncbi:flagellar motor switch phosphatase FliY [Sporolactobacillus sp. THM7-7]|nr:flagellar motor switch phosphatase FliY [Sporolactobacillus sp. THM7-7]
MSDGQLSQEEIDALIGRSGADHKKETDQSDTPLSPDSDSLRGYLSELEEDVLGEIGNISFGSAATALSTILNQKVEITTPTVHLVSRHHLADEFPVPHVSVLVDYKEGFQGSCVLVIKTKDASVIADLMMGGDGTHSSAALNEMEMSAVQEAMNQMMGSSSTAMSTVFNQRIDISPPKLTIMDVKEEKGIDYIPEDQTMFEISFRLTIGNLVDSNIMQLVPIPFGKNLVKMLLQETGGQKSDKDAQEEEAPSPVKEAAVTKDEARAPQPSGPPRELGAGHRGDQAVKAAKGKVSESDVRPAEFSTFADDEEPPRNGGTRNLDLLMDIPLDVSVELGRTRKTVKEVLEIGPGSIIELDKLAGESIDILVNQKYVAKGEVVVVDENFGIRITEILNHYDRIKDL